jgi:hypothetical protein
MMNRREFYARVIISLGGKRRNVYIHTYINHLDSNAARSTLCTSTAGLENDVHRKKGKKKKIFGAHVNLARFERTTIWRSQSRYHRRLNWNQIRY